MIPCLPPSTRSAMLFGRPRRALLWSAMQTSPPPGQRQQGHCDWVSAGMGSKGFKRGLFDHFKLGGQNRPPCLCYLLCLCYPGTFSRQDPNSKAAYQIANDHLLGYSGRRLSQWNFSSENGGFFPESQVETARGRPPNTGPSTAPSGGGGTSGRSRRSASPACAGATGPASPRGS